MMYDCPRRIHRCDSTSDPIEVLPNRVPQFLKSEFREIRLVLRISQSNHFRIEGSICTTWRPKTKFGKTQCDYDIKKRSNPPSRLRCAIKWSINLLLAMLWKIRSFAAFTNLVAIDHLTILSSETVLCVLKRVIRVCEGRRIRRRQLSVAFKKIILSSSLTMNASR